MLLNRMTWLFMLLFSQSVFAQGFLKADGKKIVDGGGREIILRGIGLGGWMLQEPYMLQLGGIANSQHEIRARIEQLTGKENTDRFYAAWLANYLSKKDIDSLAAWGFNSVRLPMHYNLFTLPADKEKDSLQSTWLETGFALTDSLLSWCRANRIYLILDLHAAPGGQGNDLPISDRDPSKPSLWQSEANRRKTIALWKKLAEHYAGEEWIGGYDLINEPNWGFTDPNDKNGCNEKQNAELKSLLMDITAAVRSVDKNHLLIIEGNCWGNNYSNIFPLWDNNTAVSFHKYWNYNDPASLQNYLKIREEQNVPVWAGESGENSNAWYTDAIRLLEQNHIGWAWWPLKKLGSNNPLQVKAPERYRMLLDYWRGRNSGLTPEEGTSILMELAAAQKIENNSIRRDVIDAMFRQAGSAETLPFQNKVLANKLVLYASDYDLGRSGSAYHDADSANYWVSNQNRTAGNRGGQYRNDGVDITRSNDPQGNGYSVGWTEPGEWLQYTVTVPQPGLYTVGIRYKPGKDAAVLVLASGNRLLTQNIPLPAAGTDSAWRTTRAGNIKLEKGVNPIRVQVIKGGFELGYLEFLRKENNPGTKKSARK